MTPTFFHDQPHGLAPVPCLHLQRLSRTVGTPDILTDHAIEFVNSAEEEPFLLALHFRAPHARWLPVADEDWAPFESLDPALPHPDYPNLDVERVKRMTREYLASVKSVDRNVGRLLAALDASGHAEDTTRAFGYI